MDKLLHRPKEAAELLGLSESRVYELIAAGVLPVVRIGKAVRIPAEALAAWVKEQTIVALQEAAPPARTPAGWTRMHS